ncbi:hypothetical protein SAMN04487820_106323 [Actinopolyspora mzabensis]|uniref:Secreted protein n=1 Tax=Actinopolyspora mzabensis TaxID=995066 RepID=A0A1G9AYI4_ACTMZ|nr:hypothetical protein [Actinopolyspora mzabensis]SDK32317.1 hypothetical protein SAMN04487820_106323 [Actinopolyspora mzabensis]
MKRTLTTVTALVAGSVGAIGFAGTAAADAPKLPAELPVDNNVAKTTYHTAATLHSAQQAIGDVVPSEGLPAAARSAEATDGDPLAEAVQHGHISGELLNEEQLNGAPGEMLQNPSQQAQQEQQSSTRPAPSSSSNLAGLPVGDVISGIAG